ncbi:MAG: protein translocase subunit SecD [Coriobacteriales bacterium]|jgi:SecD/SecF fusion protein|nr:protein translocase subunit SecD [Coriobacteriales bacterium]
MSDRRFKPKKKPGQSRNHVMLLTLLALLVATSFVLFMPPNESIKRGLDVQGGLSVILEAKKTDDKDPTSEEMTAARQIVERRVNLLGASEATVQVQGNNQLLVQIPGVVDQAQAVSTIGKTGVLHFVNVADLENKSAIEALESGVYVTDQEINRKLAFGDLEPGQIINAKPDEQTGRVPMGIYTTLDIGGGDEDSEGDSSYYQLISIDEKDYTPIFTGADITQVTVGLDNGVGPDYSVGLELNRTAAQAFKEVTTQLAPTKGKIAIVLDGAIQSAPAVQTVIGDGRVSITGNYNLQEADSLKTILQSGSLPVSLSVINAQVVGPTLGQESLMAGILVALIGLALVALYLLFFYKGIGLLTAAAVGVFAILYLGVLALLSSLGFFALSLAGIAGIVLSIGVAADSSILVLERFKEEIRMGRSVRAASQTGVWHAIKTSLDADFVTLISALALFFIAVGTVKGFGLTLAIGVVCDIITMILFKAPVVRLLAPRFIAKHPGFWGVKEDEEFALASGELNRGVANG